MDHLSHPYVTTGKTIVLIIGTFVSKVISLLFTMLSRYVIAFLPRNRHLLVSWLQSPSAVILEPKKIKSVTASIFSPSICHKVMSLIAGGLAPLQSSSQSPKDWGRIRKTNKQNSSMKTTCLIKGLLGKVSMSKDPLLLPPDWTKSCIRTSSPLMNWASACSSRTEFLPEAKVLRFEDGGWEASGPMRKPELSCREWIRNSGSHTEAPFSWPGQSLGSAFHYLPLPALPGGWSAPWGLL